MRSKSLTDKLGAPSGIPAPTALSHVAQGLVEEQAAIRPLHAHHMSEASAQGAEGVRPADRPFQPFPGSVTYSSPRSGPPSAKALRGTVQFKFKWLPIYRCMGLID